ncbi:SymE family type I addiction module toxin [Mixta gaviniae]|uniref:Toxin SymE-like domain-containing protein n=1 Tax=Mixta gaviniae TaxID=665914 RepID=A0A1X1DF91_9GAMM|nr:SymE family type I addiction module toxin [Mixta gaviniae]AUX92284.1 hypothetical protein C2E15_03725 [Mixta gaviniae]ORM75307.1 hypothetical protein HA44_18135 [Mixta gaviniae]
MAEKHSRAEVVAVKAAKVEQRYIVGYRPQRGDSSTPELNLTGKWLREPGFETGQAVTMRIAEGCLILTPCG